MHSSPTICRNGSYLPTTLLFAALAPNETAPNAGDAEAAVWVVSREARHA